jgi:hypothetical protein
MKEVNREVNNFKEEESSGRLTGTREGGAMGRGLGDAQGGVLEELDATIDTFIQFPGLGTES